MTLRLEPPYRQLLAVPATHHGVQGGAALVGTGFKVFGQTGLPMPQVGRRLLSEADLQPLSGSQDR